MFEVVEVWLLVVSRMVEGKRQAGFKYWTVAG